MSDTTAPTAPLLDLAVPRSIILHDSNRTFTLDCRRIMRDDWLAYFNSISVTSEQQGRARATVADFQTPRRQLAESVLTSAGGYKIAGTTLSGATNLTDIPNWQIRLPLSHRLELGRVLCDVKPSQKVDEFLVYAEGEEVSLDAVWSAYDFTDDEGNPRRAMQKFLDLKHTFKTPTEAQHKRFSQQASRSLVVGGSRNGRTVYASVQPILCELYDELIVAVDGYCYQGKPLTSPAMIQEAMDLHHKFIAAQELFSPQTTVTSGASTEEGADED